MGNYAAAIDSLSAAKEALPVVGDYAVFYIAKARLQAGMHEESLESISELMARHPESPLKKEALKMEITNVLATGDEAKALPLLEVYVKTSPSDAEMKYLFASLLKKSEPAKSRALFKEIYIDSGAMSGFAGKEIDLSGLSAGDLVEKASNLLKAVRYTEAEKCLRAALKKDDGRLRGRIREKLALTLFRQKRYKESGALYLGLNDLANAARSYLRADEFESFKSALDKLIKTGSPDAGPLMVSHAIERRRDGDAEEALRILKAASEKFPTVAEDALWNTGWLYYTRGEHGRALEVFTALYDKYGSNRYHYWKAKCLEKTGGDSAPAYIEIAKGEDVYGIIARAKAPAPPAGATTASVERLKTPAAALGSERIETLIYAGLPDRAASELLGMAERAGPAPSDIAGIAMKLNDLGRHSEAISLALRLPEESRPDEVLYPLAFWPVIKKISEQNDMDPYLVLSVIREESRFDARALSPAGAVGLMQLMPDTAERTARSMNVRCDDLTGAEANIELGTHYLKGLINEMGSVSVALAAYNAGEHNALKWLRQCDCDPSDEFIEDIPFRETKGYVKRILTSYYKYRKTLETRYSGLSVNTSRGFQ